LAPTSIQASAPLCSNFLIEEEDQLGAEPADLDHAARRVHEGKAHINRTLTIVEGLIDSGLMDLERFSKAMEVLRTLRDSQTLIEERYKRISLECLKAGK
jgi:predicted DNA-binding protein